NYTALDVAPVITDQPVRRFKLTAKTLGSLGVGAPIYYRSLPVGEVAAYRLAADGNSIEATLFIDAPYDQYVTSETRFWNASGIDVSVGANGVDIRTESIVSVLVGGIGFDVPDFAPPGEPVAADAVFSLYQTRALAMTLPDTVQRVASRLVGRSAGDFIRIAGRPRCRGRPRLRSDDTRSAPAGTGDVQSRAARCSSVRRQSAIREKRIGGGGRGN